MDMDDVILLENPRRRRRTRRRTPPRTKSGRFRKRRSSSRRRRRNPTTVARRRPARRRRTNASPVRRRTRRRRANPAPVRRRRRRSNPSRGGRVLSMRRAMGIVQESAGFVASEFAGDALAKLVVQRTPVGQWIGRQFGLNLGEQGTWVQLALGVLAGPMLRRARFVPRVVLKHWELANVSAALTSLTWQWRMQALDAMQLSDWVTTASAPARVAAPAAVPAIAPPAADGLSDWASVGGSASYDGNPFSM